MTTEHQTEQLQFHADRVYESTTRVLKSIVLDPRLTVEDQIALLTALSGTHVEIVETIHSAIESGCYRALADARDEVISKAEGS